MQDRLAGKEGMKYDQRPTTSGIAESLEKHDRYSQVYSNTRVSQKDSVSTVGSISGQPNGFMRLRLSQQRSNVGWFTNPGESQQTAPPPTSSVRQVHKFRS